MRSALRTIVAIAILGLLQATAPHSAGAQNYPARPITIIVPYPAGGPSDTLTRVMAEPLKTVLG
jgi:tripartite-type tricarboxylate transporter receptor subunit TctC